LLIEIPNLAFAIANPAAEYCTKSGYTYKTVETSLGEDGFCVFPDNTECEAWNFFRGECGQNYAKKHNNTSSEKLPNSEKVSIDSKLKSQKSESLLKTYPSSLDWRNKNGQNWVTPIRNQGSCSSCWAFSATAVVESRINIVLNNPNFNKDLSEQYLVSCDSANFGCSGGYVGPSALNYYKEYGVPDESCFPYTASNNTCSNRCSNWATRLVKIKGHSKIAADPSEIKQKIADYGPITAYIFACDDFDSYSGGIYTHKHTWVDCSFHSMSIVGYDQNNYWIVKNEWGTGWGESGYIRIAYSESIFNYDEWYNNPEDYRTFFLDDSYYVTDTDIDLDGVGDSIDACPTIYGTWCNGCPQPNCGICKYAYCPSSLAPYCTNSVISTLCNSTFQCSAGIGNNKYGIGGEYSCQCFCDGSGFCNYADNCVYSAECDPDDDNDGILDINDICPNTTFGQLVDTNGCSQSQVDQDFDGLCNPGKSSTWCNSTDACPSSYGPICNNGCPDLTAPSIIVSNPPPNNIYQNKYQDVIVNLTVLDSCLNSVWWTIDNGTTNNSINSPYDINVTNWSRFHYTLLVFANDSLGNLNTTNYIFVIDNKPNITSYSPNTTNISVAENSSLNFFHTSTDPDNDSLTYFWQLDGTTQNTTQNWTFSPGFFDAGIRNITLIVFDGDLSATHYWNVTVNNTNRPPTWIQLPENRTVEEDTTLVYEINASDLDNETITYYVNDTTFIINSSTGIITYTPPLNWYGIKYLTLTASDGIDNITTNITLNVTPVNDAPVLDIISNIIVNESDLVNITVNASDVEGDNLTYSINDTKFTKINQSFLWQTAFQDSGLYIVNISVSDSIDVDWQIAVVRVLEVEDADNDGINNSEDYLLGNSFSVNTTLNINMIINGSSNLSQIFNDTLPVSVVENNSSLVEFNWTFNQSNILDLSVISIEKQPNSSTRSYIVVKGINLTTQNTTKTIYLDHINTNLNTVCISDKKIASVTEISSGCNGINETLVSCNNTVQNGYSCMSIENNTRYKISGLIHSGITEQCSDSDGDGYGINCPNGNDCNDNNPAIYPGDVELCDTIDNNCNGVVDEGCKSETFSSSGGTPFATTQTNKTNQTTTQVKRQCQESWNCTDWSACTNETQTRNCSDTNNCGTNTNKPSESQNCAETGPTAAAITQAPTGLFLGLSTNEWIVTIVVGTIIALVIIFSILMKKKKSKPPFSKP